MLSKELLDAGGRDKLKLRLLGLVESHTKLLDVADDFWGSDLEEPEYRNRSESGSLNGFVQFVRGKLSLLKSGEMVAEEPVVDIGAYDSDWSVRRTWSSSMGDSQIVNVSVLSGNMKSHGQDEAPSAVIGWSLGNVSATFVGTMMVGDSMNVTSMDVESPVCSDTVTFFLK